ncbi:MAG: GHMP family kinase ATP-binding protein [Promethearchaeota archaeon]
MKYLETFAPGRVCFFGEHQDYHGLPVIAGAIDLGITITLKSFLSSKKVVINLPDVGEVREIILDYPIEYIKARDYLASSINILDHNGIKVDRGFECEVKGTLPISAGASSSSALVVSWLRFLMALFSNRELEPMQLAAWANLAEVKEFGEAGGFMDHATCAYGGVIYVKSDFSVESLNIPENFYLVLGNSMEKKDTVDDLKRLRSAVGHEVNELKKKIKDFHIGGKFCSKDFIDKNRDDGLCLRKDFPLVYANLMNGNITRLALQLFRGQKNANFVADIGNLLNEHHHYLSDYLHISTRKIEKLIQAALESGAAGCKINGSGFGGTMFVLCDSKEKQARIERSIINAGGEAYKVKISSGARVLKGDEPGR